ncbi:hypothetical protein [Nocardioides houyundeii]|uniref:hypothetical protein n=1 Tax=Nocardioides houyundeii TaxID=2045452 RepID=UPI000C7733AF|nr:hypothetical protein [Nocardioides houyundeii]
MKSRPRLLLLVPALALVLSACGGDDDDKSPDFSGGNGTSDSAQPYVEAMATSLSEGEDSPMDKKQATCFSEGFVDVIGVDRLEKIGTAEEWAKESEGLEFTELKLSKDEGGEIYDNFEKCGVDLREQMLADFADDESMDEETKTCVSDAMTEDNLREFFVTVMVEGEEAMAGGEGGLFSELTACVMSGMDSATPQPDTE